MQRLEVSGVVRPIYGTIGVKQLKQLRHISVLQSHHHQGVHYSCLLKLQLLKQQIKIHRCVVNSVVVWLHILGP